MHFSNTILFNNILQILNDYISSVKNYTTSCIVKMSKYLTFCTQTGNSNALNTLMDSNKVNTRTEETWSL